MCILNGKYRYRRGNAKNGRKKKMFNTNMKRNGKETNKNNNKIGENSKYSTVYTFDGSCKGILRLTHSILPSIYFYIFSSFSTFSITLPLSPFSSFPLSFSFFRSADTHFTLDEVCFVLRKNDGAISQLLFSMALKMVILHP